MEDKTQEEQRIEGTDVPKQPAVEKAVQPPEVRLNVDPTTALNITAQEFDKKITEAEAVVAELKKQKAAYIYDTNVQILLASAKQQNQPEGE